MSSHTVSKRTARRSSIPEDAYPDHSPPRSRSISNSSLQPPNARITRKDYIHLKLANKHLRAEVAKHKESSKRLLYLLLLALVVVILNFILKPPHLPPPIFNLPLSANPNPDPTFRRGDLLVPAKRIQLFEQLGDLYENLTLAHFGWVLQSPYNALNFAADLRDNLGLVRENAHMEAERAEFDTYVTDYLMAPWRPESPLCAPGTPSLFHPDVCAEAIRRFEKQVECFMKNECVRNWRRAVNSGSTVPRRKKAYHDDWEKEDDELAEMLSQCREKDRARPGRSWEVRNGQWKDPCVDEEKALKVFRSEGKKEL
ncbi:hypothetical protein BU26DRAFT_500801 [Trematosphaeria pertusa]|uniref:Uncharacterized protein n=1 Tax=Trematosphaeria pertusa TaxID=390896 RepID=A0A6A6IZ53_9PLEO|nr:uncharacterized protein BU26DRAFT_500801 [Trematosphaeria pertusa]KAF2255192.1 hypothetical protein BU26DRAFT_500801 [Trematosphaeria pertusa]